MNTNWGAALLCHGYASRKQIDAGDGGDSLSPDRRGIDVAISDHTRTDHWPALPFAKWQDTCATLHMWTQVVGKVRLALAPMVNHWWQVPLYVTATGLTTSVMPYEGRGVQIDFDFCRHALIVTTSDEQQSEFALAPYSVAQFYRNVMEALLDVGVEVAIWTMPVEIADAVPFERDHRNKSYEAAAAQRFWLALVQCDRVMNAFRARYLGKVSPVHFFWGSFDLAVTRFSGRVAPPHPGGMPGLGDWVAREAYSHEVSSCGFWPGKRRLRQTGVLFLCLSGAAGVRGHTAAVRAGDIRSEICANSFWPMTTYASRPIPTRPCWHSSRAPMKSQRMQAAGTVMLLSAKQRHGRRLAERPSWAQRNAVPSPAAPRPSRCPHRSRHRPSRRPCHGRYCV